MTARDINQKRIEAFKSKREEFLESEPEKAVEWQEVIKDQERIAEIIEESNLIPEAKEELARRIFLLFTEPGQYFVRGKASSEEQGTLKVDVNSEEVMEAVYEPKDGMLLTVDKSVGYDEETYAYVTEGLGQEAANILRDARSRWEKIASAAYRFGKEFFIATVDPALEQQTVFELFIEAFEDPRNEEVAKAGAKLAHEIYEGLGELWENQQFQGGLKVVGGVGEVIGAKLLAAGSTISVFGAVPGDILAAVIAMHGVDQVRTGFTQMLMNEDVPSMTARAFEEMGFSPEDARNMEMYFAMGIPFAGSYRFLNFAGKSIEMGSSALRRTAQQSMPMFFKEGTCPMIGLVEKEVYTATNPLKLKQIPASIAKEFESGGSWIMTEEYFQIHFVPKSLVGRSDGQFMVSKKAMDKALSEANGDIGKLQELLSTNRWVGKTLYRLDFKNPLDYNPRVPHQGLSGANEHFVPGGLTKGGVPEIVTDQLPKDQIPVTKLN